MVYPHQAIEKKWQDRRETYGVFHAKDGGEKQKIYCLIEFPYPSGAGLHIGHPRSYTALDVVSRKRRHQGYNVLYPIVWSRISPRWITWRRSKCSSVIGSGRVKAQRSIFRSPSFLRRG